MLNLVVTQTASILAADESPSLKPGLDANQVSPGVIGFLITLLLAVLIILVGLDHTRRQRRLQNRFDYAMAREEERLAEAEDGAPVPAEDSGEERADSAGNGSHRTGGESR
ncbi:hypothetical protein [Curtobacterium sp. S6]|uniref:hypothetical protein n=1 Tax=Curtobacterium sp. S6 TaxID=1479623 RepID=UPI00068F624B|nr:hypothetical protein [Curtobacterium sp. S6]